ncbi:MAG TPA: methyltransferase domain-containing protein [Candidatus Binatia bacterium]|jgi:SAM-dependent methyltransferase|nr:methyltransferase domain-containing protein [Candidatus Binatia bacterium]
MRRSKKSPAGRVALLLALLFTFSPGGSPLVAAELAAPSTAATNRYEFRREHDPDGIGKFFLGREIAHVMGHQAADWLERPERATEENTGRLLEELKLKPGEVVADIGAGTGYYSRRLARKVGTAGRVLAVDIQPEMLVLLTNRTTAEGITNIVPVLGTVTDPKLPGRSVDLVLLVDVYHEFDFPFEMMEATCRSLKPGGRIVFVEFRAEDPKVPIKPVHKMSEAQVKKEMAVQPLEWVQTIEVLPRQHIIVFKKP